MRRWKVSLAILSSLTPSALALQISFLLSRPVLHAATSPVIRNNSQDPSSGERMTANTNHKNEKHQNEYYRSDGVRITHDPYAKGMAEQYGLPGNTDPDGFDPYADTVGPGIYGGSVQRNTRTGKVITGKQYQNHNHRPGPIYDGTGYSLMARAIHAGPETVQQILQDFPELVNEVSTGGARPLHICGMSAKGQLSTQVLVDAGADNIQLIKVMVLTCNL